MKAGASVRFETATGTETGTIISFLGGRTVDVAIQCGNRVIIVPLEDCDLIQ